jgi:RNA polymerase sigma factor (sigma-70 family)
MNSPIPSAASTAACFAEVSSVAARTPVCSTSDAKVFDRVVLPYLADAHGLARWITGNHSDAQDVVQDSCIRALHGIGGFAGGDARTWILTIVRRTAYDWLNKNRPAALVLAEDIGDLRYGQPPESDTATAETALIEDEEKHLFENAVASLPAHYREILALRHARGLSYRDIAELTGISMGTVMSRLSRARGHLVSRIKESEARATPRRSMFCRDAVAA